MDKKSKMLWIILGGLVLVSLFFTYYRSFVSKDYEIIQGEESADPETVGEISYTQ